MSNVREFQSVQSTRTEQAGVWITKLDRGLTPEDEQALGKWLSMSAENRQEFLEIAKMWDSMDGLSRLADIFPEPADQAGRGASSGNWKIAASVLLAVGAVAMWFSASELPEAATPSIVAEVDSNQNEYETAIGEQSVFTLSDGTRLALNTNSEVLVNFGSKNRLLTLIRGEIHVNVAHDPSRPLSVVVGDKVIQAVGTEFNVEITSEQNVELVVTEGVVTIGVFDAPIGDSPQGKPVLLQPSSTLVAAGQEVVIDSSASGQELIEATEIKSEEIAVKLSWREGNLIFRGESLEEAMSEVGRYTEVEFVFLDEESKKERLTGFFKAGDVDGLLAALRRSFNISYEWVGEDKILLSGQ